MTTETQAQPPTGFDQTGRITSYNVCYTKLLRLSDRFRNLLARRYEQLAELDEHIAFYTNELELLSRQDEACRRLQTIPGFGPIVSSAFRSAIGDGRAYAHGRDAAASLGLVPRQHSSGGKNVLLGISKRGDRYLRSLLVHRRNNFV